jgi:tRNA (guanine37-N1)-methyltransferase
MLDNPGEHFIPEGDSTGAPPAPVVLFSPVGERIAHPLIEREAATGQPGAILMCGRYEGLDQRFIDQEVDQQWSLGDFVLSGGEIAALRQLLDRVELNGLLVQADALHANRPFSSTSSNVAPTS